MVLFGCIFLLSPVFLLVCVLLSLFLSVLLLVAIALLVFWFWVFLVDDCCVGDDEFKVLLLTEWWIFNVDGFCLALGNVLLFERECFLFVEDREAARNIQIFFVLVYKSN